MQMVHTFIPYYRTVVIFMTSGPAIYVRVLHENIQLHHHAIYVIAGADVIDDTYS